MKQKSITLQYLFKIFMILGLMIPFGELEAQTLAFPEATGFGRYTTGARGAANPQIYLVTNLNDSGAGSFRDAVSQPGRFVIFKVGGIINLSSAIAVAANTTIAGQTATGEGIVLLGKVSFSGSSNTIARYFRIRYGDNTQNQDASGVSNGANIILDHMTFTWGTDEVFSINWDGKGVSPDNITLQNCIIGQGLHRHNHSAGGLMQPSNGGKISLIGNLYICNKTRNNKVKGINEFVNNVVYNWGNYGNTYGHVESGDAYIMGGDSAGRSDVNIINNYFIGGPNTSTTISTPFNRGSQEFYLYGSGNYFDNNRDGVLNGTLVPEDITGYPIYDASTILSAPNDYPMKNPVLSAQAAYDKILLSVGASYPTRDQVDNLMISDLNSKGTTAAYVYDRSSFAKQFGFINNGAGHVYGAPAPLDTDNDGMPDAWEDANGLDKNLADALAVSTTHAPYLNIEVYINGLTNQTPPDFIIPPTNVNFTSVVSTEVPEASSLTINWIDSATNETNYVLERSTDGTNFTAIATLGANVTSYNETALTPNTLYYYQVKAINATASSVYNSASITTPPIPSLPTKATTPNPSSGFTFVQLNGGNLTVKWLGSANTTTYAVYFGTDPLNLSKLADVAYVAAPSYLLTGLSPAITYYWRIDATNAKGTTTGDVWNFRALTPELVGHWPFNEVAGEGQQIADISSYANNGQIDASFDNAAVRVSGKTIPGKTNNALDFVTLLPNKLMVSIPNQDQLFLDKNSFTVSFWMKADASLIPGTGISSYILCKGSMTKNAVTGATGRRFNVEVKGTAFRFAIDDDKNKTELTSSFATNKYYTGDWVHVVIMRDLAANKLRIYTNGALTGEANDATGTSVGIGEPTDLVIGNIGALELFANTTPAPYKGLIDELKIFNYALTAADVTNTFTQTFLGNEKFSQNKNRGTVYPNPVKDQIFITIPSYKSATATATLSDITGKIILKERIVSDANGLFSLNIANKKISGIYILNVSGENLNSNFKIVAE
ncbi:LamG-like jellyroll fold domain-containing protein [Flavobacterium limnophilum]|uniref:LamG-like jellyroll fold domain-containing protein n=1 Tax=Flavobacterium limnophilum TaxID=3003262 RepID=UPI002482348B|nr:LamG-like jellyroll fold domain-containing protein [Flavobacterium limnophilum]